MNILRRFYLDTPDLIILLCAIAVFYGMKWTAKKFFPDMDEKKRDSITFGIAMVLFMLIIGIRYASK